MNIKIYNKLIRDKIPQIIRQSGKQAVIEEVSGDEYLQLLNANANMFNTPYSLHRIFNIKEYKAGEYVLAPQHQFELDRDLIAKGEKPPVLLTFRWMLRITS